MRRGENIRFPDLSGTIRVRVEGGPLLYLLSLRYMGKACDAERVFAEFVRVAGEGLPADEFVPERTPRTLRLLLTPDTANVVCERLATDLRELWLV